MSKRRELARLRKKQRKAAVTTRVTLLDPEDQACTGMFQINGQFALPCPVCKRLSLMPRCIGKSDMVLIAGESVPHATMLTYSMCEACKSLRAITRATQLPCPVCGITVSLPDFQESKKLDNLIILFLLVRAWCPSCSPRPNQMIPISPSGVVPPELLQCLDEVVAPGEGMKHTQTNVITYHTAHARWFTVFVVLLLRYVLRCWVYGVVHSSCLEIQVVSMCRVMYSDSSSSGHIAMVV